MTQSNVTSFKVAIVGRPNVGKSTLFNRLIGKRQAIVQRERGTTRDRIYAPVSWLGRSFELVDTGGLARPKEMPQEGKLQAMVNQEIQKAVDQASLLLFVVEKDQLTTEDDAVAQRLKKTGKDVLLVVNKVDTGEVPDINDIYRMGFGEPVLISATHGLNIDSLLDRVLSYLPAAEIHEETISPSSIHFRLCILGEPNAGKSTLMNRLLNEERVIVSDVPGTTRDTVIERVSFEGKVIELVDTAGIQRKKKLKTPTALFSLARAKDAIANADVIFLLFDVTRGLARDTRVIFDLIASRHKACALVANKWDLSSHQEMSQYEKEVKRLNGFLKRTPMLFISALKGRNVNQLLSLATTLWQRQNCEIKTSELNKFMDRLRNYKLPASVSLKYMVQTGIQPPSFLIFAKNYHGLRETHVSYITNQITDAFNLEGVFPKVSFR